MTLQDFSHVVNRSVTSSATQLGNFLPNLIAAVVIFVVGISAATLLQKIWSEVSRIINLEKNLANLSFYQKLTKEDPGLNLTDLLGLTVWWLVFLVFLFATVTLLGIKDANAVAITFVAFLPTLIIAILYLVVGAFTAFVVNRLVNIIGIITGLWGFDYIARFSTIAVVVFSTLLSLRTLGVTVEIVRWIIIASIASAALGLGIAGKELFSNLINNIKKVIK